MPYPVDKTCLSFILEQDTDQKHYLQMMQDLFMEEFVILNCHYF